MFFEVLINTNIARFLATGFNPLEKLFDNCVAFLCRDPFQPVEERRVVGTSLLGDGFAEAFVANLFINRAKDLGINRVFLRNIPSGGRSFHEFIDDRFLIGNLQFKAGKVSSQFNQSFDRRAVIGHNGKDQWGTSAMIDISTVFDRFNDSVAGSHSAGEVKLAVCEGIVHL